MIKIDWLIIDVYNRRIVTLLTVQSYSHCFIVKYIHLLNKKHFNISIKFVAADIDIRIIVIVLSSLIYIRRITTSSLITLISIRIIRVGSFIIRSLSIIIIIRLCLGRWRIRISCWGDIYIIWRIAIICSITFWVITSLIGCILCLRLGMIGVRWDIG